MTKKTVLITGANRGIGLELVSQFAQNNWQVIACCRNPAGAGELQALAVKHPAIEIHALDVTDYKQMGALADQLAGRPIDILISNAGVYGPKAIRFGNVDPQDWRQVLEVNTIAPLMLAQSFVEHVAASQQKLIAIVSSKVGSIADNSGGAGYIYRSSKTAVNQIVKSLSIDLANRGISALSLHPGWVQTEMGGPNAEITTSTSAAGLKRIMETAGLEQSGQFVEYDGSAIPW